MILFKNIPFGNWNIRIFVPAVVMTFMLGACAISAQELKVADGWSKPEALPAPVNSSQWEDGPSISPDGNTIYFTRGRDRDVRTYYSERKGKGWSEPQELDINMKDFPTGAPHTQDGKTLYFASIRPGVIGSGDIFVTQKSGGKWKDIKNLGKIVNTKDNDGEPFISADGNILIFASTRPGGQGSTDIWMTSRTESGWNKPWNVGTPINSKHEESQPFLTQDGNEVFFMAVNRDNVPGPAVFRSLKGKESWGKPEVIVSGMVGEPTLTADKQYLYFVHLIMKGGKLVDAEIMFTRRLEK